MFTMAELSISYWRNNYSSTMKIPCRFYANGSVVFVTLLSFVKLWETHVASSPWFSSLWFVCVWLLVGKLCFVMSFFARKTPESCSKKWTSLPASEWMTDVVDCWSWKTGPNWAFTCKGTQWKITHLVSNYETSCLHSFNWLFPAVIKTPKRLR